MTEVKADVLDRLIEKLIPNAASAFGADMTRLAVGALLSAAVLVLILFVVKALLLKNSKIPFALSNVVLIMCTALIAVSSFGYLPQDADVPTEPVWSDWSETRYEAGEGRIVESKTQYSARSVTHEEEYSPWSDWSEEIPVKEEGMEIREMAMYRYCDLTFVQDYTEWSEWSEWSKEPQTEDEFKAVQTKEEDETIYVDMYEYSHWRYYNTDKKAYMCSYTEYKGENYKADSGKWEYKTTDAPLTQLGIVDEQIQYQGNWYNEMKVQKPVTQKATYYSFATRAPKTVAVNGEWSEWAQEEPADDVNIKIETKTLYQFRKPTGNFKNIYGEWSEWSDEALEDTANCEVRTRNLYRYQAITP